MMKSYTSFEIKLHNYFLVFCLQTERLLRNGCCVQINQQNSLMTKLAASFVYNHLTFLNFIQIRLLGC